MMAASVKCVIVGAGPVGALAALYAAKRGWDVEVYELRGDIRDDTTTPLNFTKSINLALAQRGINAMRQSGSPQLLDKVMADTIPMYGRMIHERTSTGELTEEEQLYDTHGRYNSAVDRAQLNRILLNELNGLPNVKLHFHHKLTGADMRKWKAWFEQKASSANARAKEIEITFDLLLGCDGAHSGVRYHLMKSVRMDYQQTYIDTLWSEFIIPPASTETFQAASAADGFSISPNHLHIWPGKEHMFIAIPSTDKSFTCTLFAPSATFKSLEEDPSSIRAFFDKQFPGAAELIGIDVIQTQFEQNPHLPLISIKCRPHCYDSSAVILGDAAHAMVPFYGQGMNAGLEDVNVLFRHLDEHPSTENGRRDALTAYNRERVPDAHSINDLALANYWEMRAGVKSPLTLMRKKVEEFLSDNVPSTGFSTQYARVSFSNERYSEVIQAVHRQGQLLFRGLVGAIAIPLLSGLAWYIAYTRRKPTHPVYLGLSFASIGARLDRIFRR